jgi:Rrf2 family transcriptional regulator, cysteine metabolism repressor
MRVSTRGQYGLRLLFCLALRITEGPITRKQLAEYQEVPVNYIEQILAPFCRIGMVKVLRGAKGGFALARAPGEIRVREILEIAEGPLNPVECVSQPFLCKRSEKCGVRRFWCELAEVIKVTADKYTLADLLNHHSTAASL